MFGCGLLVIFGGYVVIVSFCIVWCEVVVVLGFLIGVFRLFKLNNSVV